MPTITALSAENQARVLEQYRDWNVNDNHWTECVIDDAKHIGALIGFDIDKVYWTGFWSQGDGACFEGICYLRPGGPVLVRRYAPEDTDLHDIADVWVSEHRRSGWGWVCSIKQRGHYCHENCTEFNWTHEAHPWEDPENVKALEDVARRFMRWIYDRLEDEYKHLTSDEAVIDALEANEVEFEIDEDGELIL